MKYLFQKITVLAVFGIRFASCAESKDCNVVFQDLKSDSSAALLTYNAFNQICRVGSLDDRTEVIATCGGTPYAKMQLQCCKQCVSDGGKVKRGCPDVFGRSVPRVIRSEETDRGCRNAAESYFRTVLDRRNV